MIYHLLSLCASFKDLHLNSFYFLLDSITVIIFNIPISQMDNPQLARCPMSSTQKQIAAIWKANGQCQTRDRKSGSVALKHGMVWIHGPGKQRRSLVLAGMASVWGSTMARIPICLSTWPSSKAKILRHELGVPALENPDRHGSVHFVKSYKANYRGRGTGTRQNTINFLSVGWASKYRRG